MKRLVVAAALAISVASFPGSASADPVPTVQDRFAIKANTLSLHVLGSTQFRGDFYHQVGYGAALAYYPIEELGIELRAIGHHSWLTDAARELQRETGFIPDSRAREASFLLGGRISLGYGKVALGGLILHFDPQLVLQGGITVAEERRILPTVLGGVSLLMHFELGFQAQIDLLAIVDIEERNGRGAVPSFGFAPVISVGWRLDLGAL